MSVRRCQREIDAYEFAEWMIYDAKFDPFGNWRGDFQAAGVAAAVTNSQLPSTANPATRDDFMPTFYKPPPTPAEVATKLKAFFATQRTPKRKLAKKPSTK